MSPEGETHWVAEIYEKVQQVRAGGENKRGVREWRAGWAARLQDIGSAEDE